MQIYSSYDFWTGSNGCVSRLSITSITPNGLTWAKFYKCLSRLWNTLPLSLSLSLSLSNGLSLHKHSWREELSRILSSIVVVRSSDDCFCSSWSFCSRISSRKWCPSNAEKERDREPIRCLSASLLRCVVGLLFFSRSVPWPVPCYTKYRLVDQLINMYNFSRFYSSTEPTLAITQILDIAMHIWVLARGLPWPLPNDRCQLHIL